MSGKLNKRGIFYSTDALIALLIIILTLAILYPIASHSPRESYIAGDIIRTLSSMKIGEIDNVYVQNLISEGKISGMNKSILEQIGEFYVYDKDEAKNLANLAISGLSTGENIGIWYGNELLASINSTDIENSENIELERQIISGIREGSSVTGYSARAFLTSSSQKKYFYFGGYIGDGNLSLNMDYSGNITEVFLEIAINQEFDVYINGAFSGHYEKSPSEFTPARYDLSAYISNFNSGNNIISIRGNKLYIAGGYFKISYENSENLGESQRYNFPGIEGAINLYDSFYIPGNLSALGIYLHLNTSSAVFLNIGNTTVFNNRTSGEEKITLNDAYLSSLLNYNSISKKTAPVRLGLKNASYTSNGSMNADIFSVADLSGSMADTCVDYSPPNCCRAQRCANQSGCEICGGTWSEKIGAVKRANNAFIDGILNYSGNRIGLVGYEQAVYWWMPHNLSTNSTSLKSKVNRWVANGATCICCGINDAVSRMNNQSYSGRAKAMVVMSDGQANVNCTASGNAIQDAVNAACRAYQNFGIKVYSVGFGSDTDTNTLQQIAACGNGTYYYSNISEIVRVYETIARDIIAATYHKQTINVSGNISSVLYPDSYISFEYPKEIQSYGQIIANEKMFDNSSSAVFTVPPDSKIIEARVISYSGPRWTNKIKINGNLFFDLNYYGNDYISLGDPYSANIPLNLINTTNLIELNTGLSGANLSAGSASNKVIYFILKNLSAYSNIAALAEGCSWEIEFEAGGNISMPVPSNYSGSNNCYYTSARQEYSTFDAIQTAVYNLLQDLDLNNNGMIETRFSENDLSISSTEINGIPYSWDTEVQVRRWY